MFFSAAVLFSSLLAILSALGFNCVISGRRVDGGDDAAALGVALARPAGSCTSAPFRQLPQRCGRKGLALNVVQTVPLSQRNTFNFRFQWRNIGLSRRRGRRCCSFRRCSDSSGWFVCICTIQTVTTETRAERVGLERSADSSTSQRKTGSRHRAQK